MTTPDPHPAAGGPTRVALLGFGQVGQALAERIHATEAPVQITSVTDTGGTVVEPDGLDPVALLHTKRTHGSVAEGHAPRRPWGPVQAAQRAPAAAVVQVTPTDLDDPTQAIAELEAAFTAGRPVVTAAKGALALAPGRARKAAQAAGVPLLSSAATAGSVPVLELLDAALAGDRVQRIEGVLNGSTTHVLSRLEEGRGWEDALASARRAGILEADARNDLSGRDAAAKAALLHQACFGSELTLAEVDVRGIEALDAEACRAAHRRGFALRLLARIDEAGARVAPVEVPRDGPFAVTGATCAVRLVLEGAGKITLSGPGAGPRETASAVLSDVLRLGGGRRRAGVAARAVV